MAGKVIGAAPALLLKWPLALVVDVVLFVVLGWLAKWPLALVVDVAHFVVLRWLAGTNVAGALLALAPATLRPRRPSPPGSV